MRTFEYEPRRRPRFLLLSRRRVVAVIVVWTIVIGCFAISFVVRTREPTQSQDPLVRKLALFDAYSYQCDAALKMASADPQAAQRTLRDLIEKARQSGVLPVASSFPTLGESEFLRLLVEDPNANSSELDEFVAYLRKSYPTFNVDAHVQLVRRHTTSPG